METSRKRKGAETSSAKKCVASSCLFSSSSSHLATEWKVGNLSTWWSEVGLRHMRAVLPAKQGGDTIVTGNSDESVLTTDRARERRRARGQGKAAADAGTGEAAQGGGPGATYYSRWKY